MIFQLKNNALPVIERWLRKRRERVNREYTMFLDSDLREIFPYLAPPRLSPQMHKFSLIDEQIENYFSGVLYL